MRFQPAAVCLMVLPAVFSTAQPVTDSLKARLNEALHDTVRIDVLLSLSASAISEPTSLAYLRDAISLSEKTGDPVRISKGYYRLASLHDRRGNIREARAALDAVRAQLKHSHQPRMEANTIHYYGILDYFEGNYDDALAHLWQAIRRYEKMEDSTAVASCYLNIGNCYKEFNQAQNAVNYFNKALAIYESRRDPSGTAMALGNIGNIHRSQGRYDSALYCFNRSLEINLQHNYHNDARIDLNNIGNLYLHQHAYDKASPYFQRAYAMAASDGSRQGMLTAGFNLGVIALETKHVAAAIDTFEAQLITARAHHYRQHIRDLYEALSQAHEARHDYSRALSYRKEYEKWKDSLISTQHLDQVKELELRYETEKKDHQILLLAGEKQLQEKETERQSMLKNSVLAGLGLVVLLAALAIYAFRQRLLVATKDNEIREVNLRQQLTTLEMKALRAQINPHFLFNCINSINRMIAKGENDNASLYLKKFSRLVRLIVENVETNRVSLDNELSLLESYIQLEELRFRGKITYEIIVDRDIEKDNTFLPPMVLQPFVENAIWHGLMPKEGDEAGHISISVKERGDTLLCTIEDNGVGRGNSAAMPSDNGKTKSFGIRITEERLRLLSREKINGLISIIDLKDAFDKAIGTRVEISIPLT